ncbi:hypothetical protein HNP84_000013 [Thermocatellispora tengchongensis]|uniref:Uncharacterized protein n=1 Tax=Thermocatellispora tengchongensis TaxID=1073253 RepID=A0A840P2Q8_9ACTN|nr:hypothetical protein [Thermocatellispora tengchongensis]MBB5130325.1 hypothetical protein [Thermocatellispora tengchongensis]
MTKLNQILAVEKGVKAGTQRALTDAYHTIQKAPLLSGLSRTYQPIDDEGEQLPPESTRVQVKAEQVLADVAKALTRLFDVTATKDWTNTVARADVVVDGRTLIEQAPVTYLLFLEKQLTDLHTFVAKLPTLDPAETWTLDDNLEVWRTEPVKTTRTKKVPRNHVLAEATDKHPAQVQVFTEDIVVGYWTKTAFSGALPARRVNELLTRVQKLQEAVKYAREEANATTTEDVQVGDRLFAYLFA